ncbi:MAG: hypothetical protein WA777_05210 [Rhodanobacter sp.]
MIELEIQTLSEKREGLLIEVGRSAVACGFTLQKQRLAQDANGVLLTMVVRGPERKQRSLEVALDAIERVISFEVSTFVEGESKPHFAASRTFAWPTVAPAPTPTIEVAPVVVSVAPAEKLDVPEPAAPPAVPVESEPQQEPEADFTFVLPRAPAPEPAPVVIEPFVELIPLDPDEQAVEKVLPQLTNGYPHIFPALQKLEASVIEAARESSLLLAGQRTGAWLFERDYPLDTKLSLREAIERIGMPALRTLVEVEHKGDQLHIRNSPLCKEDGHSSCKFFSGYLEGLLGPAIASDSLSIFAVCCRSCGATECVLAITD